MAVLPISITCPLKVLFGDGVDGDLGRLVEFHVDDIGLIHLHLGGDQGHVRNRHDQRACLILKTGNHGLAGPHRQVRHHAFNRRSTSCACPECLLYAREVGLRLENALLRGSQAGGRLLALRPGLGKAGLSLLNSSLLPVVGEFLGVELLLGQQSFFELGVGAVEIGLGAVRGPPCSG